jgi:septum formation protein
MPSFRAQKPNGMPGFLILASSSPRRQELMKKFWPGEQLTIQSPVYDEHEVMETWTKTPEELALALTRGKLDALGEQVMIPDCCCALAADTLVLVDSVVLGKPSDGVEAKKQLQVLSGRSHVVLTGLTLAVINQKDTVFLDAVERTTVTMGSLDDAMIEWYIATGEPLDKAGSYGIQGAGSALIQSINGCYFNIIRLPIFRLMTLLGEAADRFTSIPQLSDLLPWR